MCTHRVVAGGGGGALAGVGGAFVTQLLPFLGGLLRPGPQRPELRLRRRLRLGLRLGLGQWPGRQRCAARQSANGEAGGRKGLRGHARRATARTTAVARLAGPTAPPAAANASRQCDVADVCRACRDGRGALLLSSSGRLALWRGALHAAQRDRCSTSTVERHGSGGREGFAPPTPRSQGTSQQHTAFRRMDARCKLIILYVRTCMC